MLLLVVPGLNGRTWPKLLQRQKKICKNLRGELIPCLQTIAIFFVCRNQITIRKYLKKQSYFVKSDSVRVWRRCAGIVKDVFYTTEGFIPLQQIFRMILLLKNRSLNFISSILFNLLILLHFFSFQVRQRFTISSFKLKGLEKVNSAAKGMPNKIGLFIFRKISTNNDSTGKKEGWNWKYVLKSTFRAPEKGP